MVSDTIIITMLFFLGFFIFFIFAYAPGVLGYFTNPTPTKQVKMLMEDIKNNPLNWRNNSKYFYNRNLGYVFWVSCGRYQFNCVGDVHIETRGYNKIPLPQGQLNHIYKSYNDWIVQFNVINIEKPVQRLDVRISHK